MIIRREISEKGQVVIPKDIREFLNLKARENIVFEIKNKEVILKKDQDARDFIEDFFNTPKIKRGKKTIKEMIMEQYDEEIH